MRAGPYLGSWSTTARSLILVRCRWLPISWSSYSARRSTVQQVQRRAAQWPPRSSSSICKPGHLATPRSRPMLRLAQARVWCRRMRLRSFGRPMEGDACTGITTGAARGWARSQAGAGKGGTPSLRSQCNNEKIGFRGGRPWMRQVLHASAGLMGPSQMQHSMRWIAMCCIGRAIA